MPINSNVIGDFGVLEVDEARFTDRRTGQLVPIKTPGGPDWAFLPNLLPPTWQIPESLLDLSIEAWDALGTLNGTGGRLPNPELLLRPLQSREAIQSSKLEGTYTTPEDLLLFAKNPTEPKSADDPANAWLEVYNYTDAIRAGYSHLADRPFTLAMIREMHKHLMTGVRGKDKEPGAFRRAQVAIGSDHRFVPPPPLHLTGLLENFEQFLNEKAPKRHRLAKAFIAHYQFEAIHPFLDGNGRIGRVLLALMLYKLCEHEMPWLYLSPFFENYKDEYIQKLFGVSADGQWTEWIEFCLRGAVVSAKDAILRCRLLDVVRDRYKQRVRGTCTPRTLQIIEELFKDPSLQVSEVQKLCQVSYKTARADIDVLRRAGILMRIANHFPASFYAWEIFRIAYRDRPTLASDEEIKDAADEASSPPPTKHLREDGH